MMIGDGDFPPRGSGIAGRRETPPSARWGHPWELAHNWDWRFGNVLLGQWKGRLLGVTDRRHMVTVAGSQAGKSSTVLMPNLMYYPGSVVVLDPKGELVRATAAHRRKRGQRVYVLDPFGETDLLSASHNPFDELGHGRAEHVAADAAQVADALIITNSRDPHWTDSAKNLVRGIALHMMSSTSAVTLRRVRELMNGTPAELDDLFSAMTASDAFDGIVRNIGRSFLGKLEAGGRELQGILSTAQEQTAPLDDIVRITDRSDFRLGELSSGNVSLYVVLPGLRMGTHYRWLRLVIQQALAAVERNPVARDSLPVWFVLEEFPVLGHMRSIETAAGLMAGFGVKLWCVLQDLSQLQTHYSKSWETFLGNAGIIQAFGNADVTTTEHLSKLLGSTQVVDRQNVRLSAQAQAHGDPGYRDQLRSVRLLDPSEITHLFSRESNRQLIISPGRPPIYMERLSHEPLEIVWPFHPPPGC